MPVGTPVTAAQSQQFPQEAIDNARAQQQWVDSRDHGGRQVAVRSMG